MGARQIGKTTSLKRFAETYENSVYLNFEDSPQLCALFEDQLEPQALLTAIGIETDIDIKPKQTLIIFDEIQACPRALISLKYFNEQANDYHIAAAGSLLGVKLSNTEGFPVGKVNFIDMYPLTFFEFLAALGEEKLKDYLLMLTSKDTIPSILHQKALDYFRHYLYIGGMPEAVATYLESKSFDLVREVQQSILRAYGLDFAKHAPPQHVMKINQVWQSIPSQLAKENGKFIYSVLRKSARAKDFEVAIQWLTEAGLVYKTYQTSTPKVPLKAYAKFEFFKLYLVDVGLLGAMTHLSAKTLIHGNQLFQEFQGVYTENVAAQMLATRQPELYYWVSEGKAEVDFVVENDGIPYPLEIKSGTSNKKKSLQSYHKKYQPRLLLRGSPMNLTKDNQLLNCPLYLLSQLAQLLKD